MDHFISSFVVQKKSGKEEPFDSGAIEGAINKANFKGVSEDSDRIPAYKVRQVAEEVTHQAQALGRTITTDEISDMVENALMSVGAHQVAKAYIKYRYTRQLAKKANTTDDQILTLIDRVNEDAKQENSNKNTDVNSVQRDYIAGYVSRDLTERVLLPQDVVEAHREGLIHFHDSDYYIQREHNCDLINLDDMLQNGTVISEIMIEKPKSFYTACNITTQIIAQVASNQYGGQSVSLAHLVPFVEISRQKIRKEVTSELDGLGSFDKDDVERIVKSRLAKEIRSGIQTIQYQLVTIMTTNGQAPFVTLFMYLDEVPEGRERDDLALICEEVFNQRIKGLQNEKGAWITPAFPKLIYVLDEDNISEGTPYWDLTVLAAKCTAKRMVPDYISAKKMKELKGEVYTCMGCRSFLTPDRFTEKGLGNVANAGNYEAGKHKYYGRFNQGVVTLNLVDVACSSDGDEDRFWEILDQRLELCHKALRLRHERLLGTPSDVSPILWQHGALARLRKGEPIDKLLYNGYSTISLGYAGLCECVQRMKGVSHTDPKATLFALAIMQTLNDACAKWKEAENIDYSVYGTPLESTTYKFAKCLQKRFGIIPGVTDKNYITNSYHVHVTEEISAFDKLAFESQFQALSPGGAISYVEVPNLQQNIPAVLSVMKFIYENIMYAELNTKSDYCQVCGFDGEIQVVTDKKTNKLVWECPNCGNRDENKLNVARRTCGYIGSQFWNQGRTQEIKERFVHLGGDPIPKDE